MENTASVCWRPGHLPVECRPVIAPRLLAVVLSAALGGCTGVEQENLVADAVADIDPLTNIYRRMLERLEALQARP